MGLFYSSFEFSGKLPSMDEVARAIQSAMAVPILLTGSLAMSAADEEERKLLKESKSCLRLSDATLTVTFAADRQLRRRRDARITVSLRGRDLVVTGTDSKLWGAACNAIENLGGVKRDPFPPKTPA